jgi:hypothetical protein
MRPDQPGPLLPSQPTVQARQVDGRHDQETVVGQERAKASQSVERIDDVFENVEHDDGIRTSRRLVDLLEGPLFELDPEALAPDADRPARRFDAAGAPAALASRVQEEADVRADLE